MLKKIDKIITFFIKGLVKIYQNTFSFDHGPIKFLKPHGKCKFYPTCSEYAVQVLEKKGFFSGIIYIIARITRCHPWSNGGFDEIDNNKIIFFKNINK